jgi:prepilin-type N-terminal cleavage/methylation domain-containing protein
VETTVIKKRRRGSSSGFSLVEVLVAMVVLATGLMSVVGMFVFSISIMQTAQEDLLAREKAKEALESVVSARDTGQITFDQIQNTTNAPGIFDPNFQPLYIPRLPDGLINTASYVQPGGTLESVTLPGPDGILGTADDIIVPLSNFQRQITITPVPTAIGGVDPNMRQIVVTVQYTATQQGTHKYSVTGYISRFH